MSTNWERRYVDWYCHRLMSEFCNQVQQTNCVLFLDKERNENPRGRVGYVNAVMWEYVTDVLCVDSEMLL